jgi:hypothetical protein
LNTMKTKKSYTHQENLSIAKSRGYLLLTSCGNEFRLKKAYYEYCKTCSIPAVYVIKKYLYAYIEIFFEDTLHRDLTDVEMDRIYNFLAATIKGAAKLDMTSKRKKFTFVSDTYATVGDFRGARFTGNHATEIFKFINRLLENDYKLPVCEVWE